MVTSIKGWLQWVISKFQHNMGTFNLLFVCCLAHFFLHVLQLYRVALLVLIWRWQRPQVATLSVLYYGASYFHCVFVFVLYLYLLSSYLCLIVAPTQGSAPDLTGAAGGTLSHCSSHAALYFNQQQTNTCHCRANMRHCLCLVILSINTYIYMYTYTYIHIYKASGIGWSC